MFFLELHHIVNIVLRNCGGRLVGTNGILGCGLAFVCAMALKTLASSDACRKMVMIAGELVFTFYI